MNHIETKRYRRWWLAGLLSFLMPGLGQVYNGQVTKGLFLNFLYSVWGGITFIFMYHTMNQLVTGLDLGLLYICIFISMIASLFIIFDSIFSARKIADKHLIKPYNKWYIYLLAILIGSGINYSIELTIRENVIQGFKIPSGAMKPTLQIGDYVLCNHIYYQKNNPTLGDIVVFDYPLDERIKFIKRIIGVPGDTIEVKNNEAYVNNHKLDEPYALYSHPKKTPINRKKNFGPIIVPKNEYFVMGDNRENTRDSRYWGTVKRQKINGKAIIVYFSWDHEISSWNILNRLFSIRFSRIGEIL